jgi:hypothetical protein
VAKLGGVKVKVGKDEDLYFDGDRISNRHWLAPRGVIRLSDPVLQGFVDAEMRFERWNGRPVRVGAEANVPDMARIAAPPSDKAPKPFQVLRLAVTHHAKDRHWIVLLSQEGAGLVGIDEDYFAMVEGSTGGVLQADGPNWFQVGEEFVVIMPVQLDGLRGKLEAGLKALGEG